MNEFVVWDNNSKVFIDFWELNDSLIGMLNKDELLPYIGKKDIEDNKIYADCSIFEFILETPSVESQSMCYKTLRGSFTFNDEDLRYEIDIYDDPDYCVLWYSPEYMSNFRVIDTIQENILGLIKEGD